MNARELLIWLVNNLLTESQLSVVPPGCKVSLRNSPWICETTEEPPSFTTWGDN